MENKKFEITYVGYYDFNDYKEAYDFAMEMEQAIGFLTRKDLNLYCCEVKEHNQKRIGDGDDKSKRFSSDYVMHELIVTDNETGESMAGEEIVALLNNLNNDCKFHLKENEKMLSENISDLEMAKDFHDRKQRLEEENEKLKEEIKRMKDEKISINTMLIKHPRKRGERFEYITVEDPLMEYGSLTKSKMIDTITDEEYGYVEKPILDLLNSLHKQKEHYRKYALLYFYDYDLYSEDFLKILESIEGKDAVDELREKQEEMRKILEQEGII